MDVVQIFATVGLLVATVVLVVIEYHRWRPVITLGVRYMERNGEWHAVLEVRNIGGSAASDVRFEFESFATRFVDHPTSAADLSENLRYDTLLPHRARYVYLSKVHVRHTKDEERQREEGEGVTYREETQLETIKGEVSYRRRLLRRRKFNFELEPDPKWWLGELPDFSAESVSSVFRLGEEAGSYNLRAKVKHAHPEVNWDGDDE